MANSPKVDMITSFSGGEYTPALAGHVDMEAYKNGSRYIENLIPEVQGGLKKFYGTRELAVLTQPSDYVLVPFDGLDTPVVLVFHDGVVSVVDGDNYYDTSLSISVAGLSKLTWAQQNAVMYFAHPTTPPFSIRYLGRDNNSKLVFQFEEITFKEVPYFPVGWDGNFNGTITTNGETGTIQVSTGTVTTLKLKLPASFVGSSGAVNVLRGDQVACLVRKRDSSSFTATLGNTTVELIRKRNGVESVVATISTGIQQTAYGNASMV